MVGGQRDDRETVQGPCRVRVGGQVPQRVRREAFRANRPRGAEGAPTLLDVDAMLHDLVDARAEVRALAAAVPQEIERAVTPARVAVFHRRHDEGVDDARAGTEAGAVRDGEGGRAGRAAGYDAGCVGDDLLEARGLGVVAAFVGSEDGGQADEGGEAGDPEEEGVSV